MALNAGWDFEILVGELDILKGEDFDLNLLGFDDGELDALFAKFNPGLTDPDDARNYQSILYRSAEIFGCLENTVSCVATAPWRWMSGTSWMGNMPT